MANLQNRPFKLFVLLLLSFFILSCSLERKIAKSYVKTKDKKSILLYFPTELSKLNLKAYRMPAKDSLLFADIDSFLMNKSLFLQYIDDSVFISKCKQSMIKELNNYGINVYEYDQINEFMNLHDSSYVINLAQMQLEEYILQDSAEDIIDGLNYKCYLELDAINLNSWFELSRNRVHDERYPILYSSYFVCDSINGAYVKSEKNDSITFFYRRDTLALPKIYELAENAGKKYASNFYDYLLNIYVQDHLPKDQGPKFYFHYDREEKRIQPFYYDGFTEMDPENKQ
ncbi:MAG: hypothetical protein CVU00_07840 [Bacteroidetes bacterium HGW-Bacteroidetes-17]|jgi:hypothetical protein|nr:MAG: hypothetical protein CVU00_07840 [Bacteroidetes bacterium HGW-Bacteroidetes-17]